MGREVLSSSPRGPGTGLLGTAQSCSGRAQIAHSEARLYREGGQTLEQLPGEGGDAPALSVHMRRLDNVLNSTGSPEALGQGDGPILVGPFQLVQSVLLFVSLGKQDRKPQGRG